MKRFAILSVLLTSAALAQTTTQPMPSEVDTLRAQVAALQAQVADLQRQLAEVRGTATTKPGIVRVIPPKPLSPIDQAIHDHKLVSGMTFDDVCKSLGVDGHSTRPPYGPKDGAIMEWKVPPGGASEPGTYHASFTASGQLAHWAKQ
jgi:hypothetical protein